MATSQVSMYQHSSRDGGEVATPAGLRLQVFWWLWDRNHDPGHPFTYNLQASFGTAPEVASVVDAWWFLTIIFGGIH